MEPNNQSHVVHFGVFEVNLRTGELRRQGISVKLQEQPFQVLAILLQKPGQIATCEELQKRLWPENTLVDFHRSLNKAINKIRDALGDSADNPRFVETLARRGYRFIMPMSRADQEVATRPQKDNPIQHEGSIVGMESEGSSEPASVGNASVPELAETAYAWDQSSIDHEIQIPNRRRMLVTGWETSEVYRILCRHLGSESGVTEGLGFHPLPNILAFIVLRVRWRHSEALRRTSSEACPS